MKSIPVETKTCKHCGTSFPITDKDLEFYDKVSPVFSGKKYAIPSPTLCPDCRQQRRLSFRNERNLYRRNCDATGKSIISVFSPDKPFKVYHQDFWWSDAWNPLDYGRDFDFNRPFFEQFAELARSVPKISSPNKNSVNCEYSNIAAYSKDCYLSNTVHHSENILYSWWIIGSSDSIDCSRSTGIQNSFQLINCNEAVSCSFSQNLKNCDHVAYSYDLEGCSNCFLCSGLKNQTYRIRNESYAKDSYEREVAKLLSNLPELKDAFLEVLRSAIRRENNNTNTESSQWNNLVNCKGCLQCFDIVWWNGCKYCFEGAGIEEDCMDCSYMGGWDRLTLSYESISVVGNESFFSSWTWYNDRVMFVDFCLNSSHLFGCIGLRNKSYCILNKQYSKEEYEALVPKIIEHMRATGEWGEFFPSSISPFGYNETVAQEYFPLAREQALAKNFNWSGYEPPFPKVEKTIPASKLPENIEDVPDDILNWAIECEVTKKPFRIIKQELDFYRKHRLPIPRRHPDQRHLDRMALRNPRRLFERKCGCPDCAENNAAPDGKPVTFLTTYSPERPEKVYCEKCYAKEVLG